MLLPACHANPRFAGQLAGLSCADAGGSERVHHFHSTEWPIARDAEGGGVGGGGTDNNGASSDGAAGGFADASGVVDSGSWDSGGPSIDTAAASDPNAPGVVDIGTWDTGQTATIGDYGVLGGTAAVIAGGYLAAGPTVAGLIGATLAAVGGLTVDAAVGGPISQSAMSVIDTSQTASQLAADPAAFGQSLGMFGSSAADVAAAGTVANDGSPYLYAFAGSQ